MNWTHQTRHWSPELDKLTYGTVKKKSKRGDDRQREKKVKKKKTRDGSFLLTKKIDEIWVHHHGHACHVPSHPIPCFFFFYSVTARDNHGGWPGIAWDITRVKIREGITLGGSGWWRRRDPQRLMVMGTLLLRNLCRCVLLNVSKAKGDKHTARQREKVVQRVTIKCGIKRNVRVGFGWTRPSWIGALAVWCEVLYKLGRSSYVMGATCCLNEPKQNHVDGIKHPTQETNFWFDFPLLLTLHDTVNFFCFLLP